ncbi:hypothetical protein [Geobacter sulfurreducens]|uniref:hypothetical protein n=1 Tax=Geobacter sulfurreducens TaxID=35554 RepID=UPI002CA11F97|nr:hypothetical protein [Geobacter sulfurreducens]HML80036.1 hypothetical protein [Geobacter sulfurreducens]
MGGADDEIEETAEQRELFAVMAEQWNLYQSDHRPFELEFIGDVTGPTQGREKALAGNINADVAQKATAILPAGTDPRRMATTDTATPVAQVAGKAQATGGQAIKDQRLQGMQTVVDLGMGKAASANLGFKEAAETALNKAAGDQQYEQAMGTATGNAIMGAVGAGTAIAQNWPTSPGVANPYGGGGHMTAINNNLRMDQPWWNSPTASPWA